MINATWISAILFTVSIYGTMAMMSIASGLVVVAWAWNSFISKGKLRFLKKGDEVFFSPLPYRLHWWTWALALLCAWSLVWAKFSGLEFFGRKPNILWVADLAKLWHLFFTLILIGVLRKFSQPQLRKLLFIWLGTAFFAAALGIIQHYIPVFKPQYIPNLSSGVYYHATGLTGFHLSYVSIMGFPLMVWLAIRPKDFPGKYKIHLYSAGVLVFLLSQLFAYSKTNWVAVALSVFALILILLKGKKRWFVLSGFIVAVLILAQSSAVRERFSQEQLFYGTLRDRLYVWSANFEMIRQFPFFGVGWHHNSDLSGAYYDAHEITQNRFESHAHNNFLDQWATTGSFGLIAFLLYCGAALLVPLTLAYHSRLLFFRFGLGIVFGWLLLHFNGLTQTNFWDAKILHQISWVIAFSVISFERSKVTEDFNF